MARYALLIGISEYSDPKVGTLKKSIRDVEALERVLADPERGNFSVTKLINCTKRESDLAVSALTKKRVHGETILLYFSGHGIRDDDCNLYLALSDTESDDLWATAILAPNLCHVLDKSLADEQLVILDCCHSGSFAVGAKATLGDSVGTKDIFIREGKGRVVLTASDATSFAWESGSDAAVTNESLFTHHLVRGIESGDADLEGDARIDADELYRYVYREVVRDRPDQHPLKFGQAQEGKLIVSRAPVKVRPLPDAVRSALHNPIKGVRVAIVETLENTIQHGNPGERIAAYAALRSLARDDSREVSAVATGALKRNAMPPGFVEEESERAAVPSVAAEAGNAAPPSQSASPPPAPPPVGSQAEAVPPSPAKPEPTVPPAAAAAPDPVILAGPAAPVSDPDEEDSGGRGPVHLLAPSLLDRLIDDDPTTPMDGESNRFGAIRQSIHGLHRDLVNLLNTVTPLSDALAEFPEVQASVLNYGLPDIQSFDRYSPGGHHRIARRISEALRRFEPRLGHASVTSVVDQAGPSGPRFKIQALTQTDLGKGPVTSAAAFTVDFDSGPATLKIDK
jgi:type VI secretion system lysozyme-like protein